MALAFLALRANKSLNLEPSSRREKPTTPKRKTKNKEKSFVDNKSTTLPFENIWKSYEKFHRFDTQTKT